MVYLQADRRTLINLRTFEFVPMNSLKCANVLTPFYLWEFKEDDEHDVRVDGRVTWSFIATDILELKGFRITVHGTARVVIELYDRIRGMDMTLEMICSPSILGDSISVYRPMLDGVSANLKVNSRDRSLPEQVIRTNDIFDERRSRQGMQIYGHVSRFHPVDNLSYRGGKFVGADTLSFGISPHQYEVSYRGRKLNGSSYAWLYGASAVLLGDDLSFDSLVLLGRCSNESLDIQRVLYTVNPYIVRVQTLLG